MMLRALATHRRTIRHVFWKHHPTELGPRVALVRQSRSRRAAVAGQAEIAKADDRGSTLLSECGLLRLPAEIRRYALARNGGRRVLLGRSSYFCAFHGPGWRHRIGEHAGSRHQRAHKPSDILRAVKIRGLRADDRITLAGLAEFRELDFEECSQVESA